MPMIQQHSDSKLINKRFFKKIKSLKNQSKIFPFLWVHPNVIDHQLIEVLKPSGIKFHPSISQLKIDQAENLLELSQTYEIPLLIHCGRNEKSRIDHIIPFFNKYDDVKIIIGHLGGLATDLILRSQKLFHKNPPSSNIYFDTSGCVNPQLIRQAIDQFGAQQILFGSDIPFFDPRICKYAVELAIDGNIKEKELIYSKNALNLLKRR